jgi:hypothetical protein
MLLWGWRLPFLTSTLTAGLLALHLRRDMPEPGHVGAARQRLKGLPQRDAPSMVVAIDDSSSANKQASRPAQQPSGSDCQASDCTTAKPNVAPYNDQQQEHGYYDEEADAADNDIKVRPLHQQVPLLL